MHLPPSNNNSAAGMQSPAMDSNMYEHGVLDNEKTSFAWADFPLLSEFLSSGITNSECEERLSITQSSSLPELHQIESREAIPKDKVYGKKKSVSFSSFLTIQSHEIILGDHPCCKNLAIGLGAHKATELVDLECFEMLPKRRDVNELRMSYEDRVQLLRTTTGLTEQELLVQELQNIFNGGAENERIPQTEDRLTPTLKSTKSSTHLSSSQSKNSSSSLRKLLGMPTPAASVGTEKKHNPNAANKPLMRRSLASTKSIASLLQ